MCEDVSVTPVPQLMSTPRQKNSVLAEGDKAKGLPPQEKGVEIYPKNP
jgi:hypothetical protein